MRTLSIQKVSVIPFNKAGEAINVVAIRLDNGTAIIRRNKQFLIDLRESFLIGQDVDSINDPSVLRVLRQLKNGTVTGDVAYHEAGSKYFIDENHNALTNPNHRLYGKVVVGQEMETEKAGWRVTDGFLDFEVSVKADVTNANAEAYADKRIKFEGFMKAPAVAESTEEPVVENFDIEEVLDKVVIGEGK